MTDTKTEPKAAPKQLTPEQAKIHQIRKDRSTRPGAPKWKAPDGTEHAYHPDQPEEKVAVMVNNGQHPGFYAIGRYFPNGLTADVPVTEHELEELKGEPKEIIRVVDASEVASLAGKGSSGSLSHHEQKVLAHFRSSGLDSDAYLAQHQKTATGSSSSSSSSEASSSGAGEHHKGKQK